MNKPIVTTNLRLPYTEWLQIKTMAAEAGISVNEYIRLVLGALNNIRSLTSHWIKPQKGKLTIWDLPTLAHGNNIPMGTSPEDESIYG